MIDMRQLHQSLPQGATLRTASALALHDKIYLSQYIGDIQSSSSIAHYKKAMGFWKDLLCIHEHAVASDKHPDMITTRTVAPLKHLQHRYTAP
jgi:hydrogenase maturation factor HypF (carbamoyltransferase family)